MSANKIYVDLTISERWGVIGAGVFDRECTVDSVMNVFERQIRMFFHDKGIPYVEYMLCFTMSVPVDDYSKKLKEFPTAMSNGITRYDRLSFWAIFPKEFIQTLARLQNNNIYLF